MSQQINGRHDKVPVLILQVLTLLILLFSLSNWLNALAPGKSESVFTRPLGAVHSPVCAVKELLVAVSIHPGHRKSYTGGYLSDDISTGVFLCQ